MDRAEAPRSGRPLLTPEDLDVARWARDGAEGAALWTSVLERAFQHLGLAPSCVALAGHLSAGIVRETCALLERDGWSFVAGERVVGQARRAKTAAQIDAIRAAARGVEDAYRHVARRLLDSAIARDHRLIYDGADLRVGDLRSLVGRVLASHGLEQPEGNIVAPGGQGAVPHSIGDDSSPIRAGETLVVDIFPRGELFVDCTRTFVVGAVPEAVRAAYDDVLSALELAESTARPGVRGWALQQAVCDHLRERDRPTPIHEPGTVRGYVHGLGHGVGWEVHELPSFREHASEADGALAAGDVFTLEPGLYEPSETSDGAGWAIRIEDTFAVSPVSSDDWRLERLSTMPRDLDPRAQLRD